METFGPVSPACRVPALGEICGVLGAVEPLGDGVDGAGLVGVGFEVGVGVDGFGVEGVPGAVEVGVVGVVPGDVGVVLFGPPGVLGVVVPGGVTGVLGAGVVGRVGLFDGSPEAELSGAPGPDVPLVAVVVVPGVVVRLPGAEVVGRPGFSPECEPGPAVVASSGEVAGSELAPGLDAEPDPSSEGALLRSVVMVPLFPEAMSTADPGAPEETACTSPSAPPPAASTAAIGTAARNAGGRRGPRWRPPEPPRSKGGRSLSSPP